MTGEIKLGLAGREITLPSYGRQLEIVTVELLKTGTTASGLDVEDVIGYKHEFTITFETLTGPDCEAVVKLYELHKDLNLILTNRDGTTSSYTVKLEPIDLTRETVSGNWLWANPVLKMRERKCTK